MSCKMGRPVVVVVGAGSKHDEGTSESDLSPSVRWGLGGALALPFAEEGYDIVLMGRRKEVLDQVGIAVAEVHKTHHHSQAKVLCLKCDLTNEVSVRTSFGEIQNGDCFGSDNYYIDLVMFNVACPYPSNFKFEQWGEVLLPHQIDIQNMNQQFDTQINGLLRVCKQVIPEMMERKRGCILLSGESCCNLHGAYEFGSVSPARAAMRSLSQTMFQAYAPMGIHVCNINIGGVIDSPRTRRWMSPEKLTKPIEIAGQFLNAYKQPPTVWSYEIQIHPAYKARSIDKRM